MGAQADRRKSVERVPSRNYIITLDIIAAHLAAEGLPRFLCRPKIHLPYAAMSAPPNLPPCDGRFFLIS
jgi:hypothetical protein